MDAESTGGEKAPEEAVGNHPGTEETPATRASNDDNKRAALVAVGSYSTTMLALGGVFLGLSLTALWPAFHNKDGPALLIGVLMLLGSLYCGVRVLGKQVTMLRNGELLKQHARNRRLTAHAMAQLALLFLALFPLAWFARSNIDLKKSSSSPTTPSSQPPSTNPCPASPPFSTPHSPWKPSSELSEQPQHRKR